jgi:hypothetical protein
MVKRRTQSAFARFVRAVSAERRYSFEGMPLVSHTAFVAEAIKF